MSVFRIRYGLVTDIILGSVADPCFVIKRILSGIRYGSVSDQQAGEHPLKKTDTKTDFMSVFRIRYELVTDSLLRTFYPKRISVTDPLRVVFLIK